jgi:hypothetical protein
MELDAGLLTKAADATGVAAIVLAVGSVMVWLRQHRFTRHVTLLIGEGKDDHIVEGGWLLEHDVCA